MTLPLRVEPENQSWVVRDEWGSVSSGEVSWLGCPTHRAFCVEWDSTEPLLHFYCLAVGISPAGGVTMGAMVSPSDAICGRGPSKAILST